MYESDGSIMVYWHALDGPETPTGGDFWGFSPDALLPESVQTVIASSGG